MSQKMNRSALHAVRVLGVNQISVQSVVLYSQKLFQIMMSGMKSLMNSAIWMKKTNAIFEAWSVLL